ncbi:TPA: hypothetical protein JLC89_004100 [Escherichia coli]|nr:hypothetical protein [Escherichia coli]HAV8459290.1 hypothetical protein [Escherichia coli]
MKHRNTLFVRVVTVLADCGVVINSGLSASSLDEPASLEWRWMREILPILDRFEENDQKCIFLRSNLDGFNH